VKRISYLSGLSIIDLINPITGYKELFVSWPKYLKHLKSLVFPYSVQNENPFSTYHFYWHEQGVADLSKSPKLTTDFLKYVKRLENLEINGPSVGSCSVLGNLWHFNKYPVSIEKLSLCNVLNAKGNHEISLARFKKLKSFEIELHRGVFSMKFMKKITDLLPQAPQLEALKINFTDDFEIDNSICAALKKLENLKELKIRFSLQQYSNNIEILRILEKIPLRKFGLSLVTRTKQDLIPVISFLEKKKTLEALTLVIKTEEIAKTSDIVQKLFKTIDDLPQLKYLDLCAKPNTINHKKEILFCRRFCNK